MTECRWRMRVSDCWDKTTLGYVYFVQHGRCWNGPIKVGWARDPAQRIRELQMGTPVELVPLGSFPGNAKLERMIHRYFDEFCIRGEWFEPTDELFDLATGKREVCAESYVACGLPIPPEYAEDDAAEDRP